MIGYLTREFKVESCGLDIQLSGMDDTDPLRAGLNFGLASNRITAYLHS